MRYLKNHLMIISIIFIGFLLLFIPIFTDAVDRELTIDGMYNFIGSFFGIIGAVLLAFSESKTQNTALREEIELNSKKERQIQAEFLYKEMLFQKIENLYAKLNTSIYKNEEIIRFIRDTNSILANEQITVRLVQNRNETEKLIHDIELISIYFTENGNKVEKIVSLFNYSNKYLSKLEHEFLIDQGRNFNKELSSYQAILKRLVFLLDDLSIDMITIMKNEITKLNDLSNLNQFGEKQS